MWRSEVTTIKKGKIFHISLNIAHFSIFFFLQNLISTCKIYCVNLMVYLYLALNLETYFKKWFWKISFCHSFLNKIYITRYIFAWVVNCYLVFHICYHFILLYYISSCHRFCDNLREYIAVCYDFKLFFHPASSLRGTLIGYLVGINQY